MTAPITHFRGPYRFLSNFYGTGRVEWRFQATKTVDPEEREWVLSAISGGEAKHRGRKVTLRPDWEEIKEDVMLALLREKFSNEGLAELLLATYPAELIEDATRWHDDYWGVVNGAGLNRLGVLLMQVRDELGERS